MKLTQSDLKWEGTTKGKHQWTYESWWFYWEPKARIVTTDPTGTKTFCSVTAAPRKPGEKRVRKPLTKTDAKRCIVMQLAKEIA